MVVDFVTDSDEGVLRPWFGVVVGVPDCCPLRLVSDEVDDDVAGSSVSEVRVDVSGEVDARSVSRWGAGAAGAPSLTAGAGLDVAVSAGG